jgi:hypothetical protein
MSRSRVLAATPARIAATILLTALALTGTADARRARQPIQLRIEGYFAAAPEGVRPLRTVDVRIGREVTRRLAVRRVVNLSPGQLGATILDEASRFRPSFRFTGDRALIARLEAAPDGRLVTITGNLSSGRHVLLSLVDVDEPSPTTASEPAPTATPPPG